MSNLKYLKLTVRTGEYDRNRDQVQAQREMSNNNIFKGSHSCH